MSQAHQPVQAAGSRHEYDGFISYSHAADDLLAPRLQSALQRFAKPWWKRRAVRIFRDESSLSANPHLWSSITEALDTSGWFVLLLSPDAARSEWVNQEIAYWVENRDPRRILPVVTDGSFGWDGEVTGDAVPNALRGVFTEEPRWVDVRWAKDEDQLDLQDPRFADAVADIASTIRGIPKDDLASEEVRQHRRTVRTAWAAGIVTAALAVAAVGFGIQSARNANEAERQAAIAEANAAAEATARAEADANADEAQANAALAQARELAASAIGVLEADPGLATWLALLAIGRTPEGSDQPVEVVNALWNAVAGNPLLDVVEVGPPGNTFLDLSPDGDLLAVSSAESSTIELRRVDGFEVLWRYSEETEDGFSKPSFSPDGARIAFAVVDSSAESPWRDGGVDDLPNRVVILDVASGAVEQVLGFPDCASVDTPVWSQPGDILAVATGPGGCVRSGIDSPRWMEAFDTTTWQSLAVIEIQGEANWFLQAEFVGVDRLAAFPSHDAPEIYDTTTFELVEVLDEVGAAVPAGVSTESGRVAIFSNEVLLMRMHDLATGDQLDLLGELEAWPTPPFGISFTRDGRRVMGATGGPILVWDVGTGEQVLRLSGGAGSPNAVFSPDGGKIYSAHLDGTVKVWSTAGSSVLDAVEVLDEATFINGNTFSVGSSVGAMERIEFEPFGRFVQFFSTDSGAFIGPPLLRGDGGPAAVLEDDRFLVIEEGEQQWRLLNPSTGQSEDVGPPCLLETCAAMVSTDRLEFAILLEEEPDRQEWEVLDAGTLEPIGAFSTGGWTRMFGDDWVLFEDPGSAFVFSGRTTGEEILRIPVPPAHSEWSPDGRTVAVSASEGAIHLVDTVDWSSNVLDLGVGRRRGMSFSPSGRMLAVGDSDQLVLIDLDRGEIVQEVPIPLVSDIFWFSESEILVADRSGLWARLSLDLDDLVERALSSLEVRPLTEQECTTYRIDPCPTLEELQGG